MRAPSSHAAVIALGFAALGVAALKLLGGADWTPLALFAAALIVTELVEDADRIRTREPSDFETFRVASALHIAAAIVLGPGRPLSSPARQRSEYAASATARSGPSPSRPPR
jgi:hypothetical protein